MSDASNITTDETTTTIEDPAAAAVPAAATAREPEDLVMDLDLLVNYPSQATDNPPCSRAANAELATDIEEHGQREPIHVLPPDNAAGLPPYTILDGHRRRDACRHWAHTDALVRIRWDLLQASPQQVHELFLGFNRHRRHYDHATLANSLVRQEELTRGCGRGRLDDAQRSSLAGHLVKLAGGLSRRNAQRYIHLVSLPAPVLETYRRGLITLARAAALASLPKGVQKVIAGKLKAAISTQDVQRILEEHRPTRQSRDPYDPAHPSPKPVTPLVLKLLKSLGPKLVVIEKHMDRIDCHQLVEHLAGLRKTQELLGALVTKTEQAKAQDEALAEVAGVILQKLEGIASLEASAAGLT